VAGVAELKSVESSGRAAPFQQRAVLSAFDAVIRSGDVARNKALVYAAFPGAFAPVAAWGDAVSAKMFERLRAKGFERFWLGVSSMPEINGMPGSGGGPRGSWDSCWGRTIPMTAFIRQVRRIPWETAQFDAGLLSKKARSWVRRQEDARFMKKGYC